MNSETDNAKQRLATAQRIDSVGWGLFFVWVGIALLFDVGWGLGLIGVGLIILGGQAARWHFGLVLEGFWVVVGALLMLAGVLEFMGVEASLVPVILIIAGLALLLSALARKST